MTTRGAGGDCCRTLEQILGVHTIPTEFAPSDIERRLEWVAMRDGIRLATDIYAPAKLPAPVITVRTPYGRKAEAITNACLAFAERGYVAVAQDCRGTGDSQPDCWNYYVFEREDSFDFVEWVVQQPWYGGYLGGIGGSYLGATQWCMAMHPGMSAIAPEVCGLGVSAHPVASHMFVNAYARAVGKGPGKSRLTFDELEHEMLDATLSSGLFDDSLEAPFPAALVERYPELEQKAPADARKWLWHLYAQLGPAQRAEVIKLATDSQQITPLEIDASASVFGAAVAHDAHLIPCRTREEVVRGLHAPALMITGWYDWHLDDALATWKLLARRARPRVRSRSRLLIGPNAHLKPGYTIDRDTTSELQRIYRTQDIVELLLHWHSVVRHGLVETWPTVTYFLMGANEWRTADTWPPPDCHTLRFYLAQGGNLVEGAPARLHPPDTYVYDPNDPTPTLGGSIISFVFPTGSVDLSLAEPRSDSCSYTSAPLVKDLDVVGPIRLILYASSTARDTDFAASLSDVFPDGREILLQSNLLRARFRDLRHEPMALEPGQIYRFEIDMWATANRFKAGHRLRLNISSADFPRFNRNSNLGGEAGSPRPAKQSIFIDLQHPSHLILSVQSERARELVEG